MICRRQYDLDQPQLKNTEHTQPWNMATDTEYVLNNRWRLHADPIQ